MKIKEETESKKSFLMYYDYEELLEDLSDEELGKLVRAMFKYEKLGFEDEKLTGITKMAFAFIKRNLKRDKETYDKRSETSKINGKRGGRPKKEKPKEETYSKPNNLKKADKDKEKEKDKDKDKDKDIEEETTKEEKNCFSFCEEQFGRTLSPVEYQTLMNWKEWFSDDVINFAIKKTLLNGARGLNYTTTIINSWHDKCYKTLKECMLEKNKHKQNEEAPDWYGREIAEDKATLEEIKDLERRCSYG